MAFASSSIVSEQVQVFRMKTGWKIFLAIFMPILAAGCGWLMVLPFVSERSNDMTLVVIFLLLGGGGFLLCVCGFLSLFKARIELYPDKIRQINLFKAKELFIKDIEGFRVAPNQNANALVLIPKKTAAIKMKKMNVSLQYERESELLDWFRNKLVDLDVVDFQEETKQIENNTRLGETKEDRLGLVAKAKNWARLINAVGYIVVFWSIFWPHPFKPLMFALVACPLIALVLLRLFKGVLKFNRKTQSAYPSIDVALVMPACALGLRALGWNILLWDKFWMTFAVATVCLIVLVILFTPYEKKTIGYAAGLLILCSIYAASSTVIFNGLLDTSSPLKYNAKITDKWISSGKHKSYNFKMLAPDSGYSEVKIDVNKATYDQNEIGNSIQLVVRSGKFGMPWCYVLGAK